MTVSLLAPVVSAVFTTRAGNSYTSDANSILSSVKAVDIPDLIAGGCTWPEYSTTFNNSTATTNPGATNDSTQDYAVGSRWVNKTSAIIWMCVDATASAAIWIPHPPMIGFLIGANMNVTTDNTIPIFTNTKYRVTKISVLNASTSLTTAVGGVYPAASKGGTALVANTQAYSALTGAALALDLTMVTTATVFAKTVTSLFLNLTTAQGAPATADVFVYGDRYNV